MIKGGFGHMVKARVMYVHKRCGMHASSISTSCFVTDRDRSPCLNHHWRGFEICSGGGACSTFVVAVLGLKYVLVDVFFAPFLDNTYPAWICKRSHAQTSRGP